MYWKDSRGADATPVTWDCSTWDFLGQVLLERVEGGCGLGVYEIESRLDVSPRYKLNFTQLSMCAPHMAADPRSQMINFMFESDLVKTECSNSILLGDKDISRLIAHAQ